MTLTAPEPAQKPQETQQPTPEATEPEATEPEATEPEATEPEATEPEATEPEATEPEATEPEATEPEATEPEATEKVPPAPPAPIPPQEKPQQSPGEQPKTPENPPGASGGNGFPPLKSPVANPQVRGKDNYGSGAYGAPRDGGKRQHGGVDVVTKPGETVTSPVSGTVKTFDPYRGNPKKEGKFQGVQITDKDGNVARVMYINHSAYNIKNNQHIEAGAPIGKAQDLSTLYKGITPHVHVDIQMGGVKIDPTPMIIKQH